MDAVAVRVGAQALFGTIILVVRVKHEDPCLADERPEHHLEKIRLSTTRRRGDQHVVAQHVIDRERDGHIEHAAAAAKLADDESLTDEERNVLLIHIAKGREETREGLCERGLLCELEKLFRERERAAVSVSEPAPSPAAPSTAAEPALPPGPRLALAGIAEQLDADRLVRTAVVSGAGDLWLVREGSLLAGRYRVERIAVDTVYLVDTLGGPDRVLRMR